MPSTTTRPLGASTWRTTPVLPRSFPVMTSTVSFRLIFAISDHLRRKRNDLHEFPLPQLARDRAENARAPRVLLVGKNYRRVFVEADQRAIRPAIRLCHSDNDGSDYVAL